MNFAIRDLNRGISGRAEDFCMLIELVEGILIKVTTGGAQNLTRQEKVESDACPCIIHPVTRGKAEKVRNTCTDGRVEIIGIDEVLLSSVLKKQGHQLN